MPLARLQLTGVVAAVAVPAVDRAVGLSEIPLSDANGINYRLFHLVVVALQLLSPQHYVFYR